MTKTLSQFLSLLDDLVLATLTDSLALREDFETVWIQLVCGGDDLLHFVIDTVKNQPPLGDLKANLLRIAATSVLLHAQIRDKSGSANKSLVALASTIINSGLRENNINARYLTARLLAQSKPPPECIRELRRSMEVGEEPVSIAAAAALSYGRTQTHLLVKQLERGLNAHENGLALDAARALVRLSMRCAQAKASILTALHPDHPNSVFCLAALAESRIRDQDAALAVARLVLDTALDSSLRGLAAETLGAIALDRDEALHLLRPLLISHEAALISGWANACKMLGIFPDEAAILLSEYLTRNSEPTLRIAALQAIVVMGTAAIPILHVLIARAHTESVDEIAGYLAYAMSSCGDEAIPRIAQELQSENSTCAVVFGAALARMGPSGAKALCELFVTESSEFKRGIILAALRELGHDASAIVHELNQILLRENHEQYIKMIASVVESSGSGASQAVPGLVKCLLTGSEVAATAAERALRSIGPSITSLLLDVWDHASPEKRNRLIRVMRGWDLLAEPRFAPLLAFDNDAALERFALAADVLCSRGAMSYERMTEIISTRKSDTYLYHNLSISASTLRLTMSDIKAMLGADVVVGEKGRPREITPAGRQLFRAVREYLRRKRVVRPIISA